MTDGRNVIGLQSLWSYKINSGQMSVTILCPSKLKKGVSSGPTITTNVVRAHRKKAGPSLTPPPESTSKPDPGKEGPAASCRGRRGPPHRIWEGRATLRRIRLGASAARGGRGHGSLDPAGACHHAGKERPAALRQIRLGIATARGREGSQLARSGHGPPPRGEGGAGRSSQGREGSAAGEEHWGRRAGREVAAWVGGLGRRGGGWGR